MDDVDNAARYWWAFLLPTSYIRSVYLHRYQAVHDIGNAPGFFSLPALTSQWRPNRRRLVFLSHD
jgi:hypothetical protein